MTFQTVGSTILIAVLGIGTGLGAWVAQRQVFGAMPEAPAEDAKPRTPSPAAGGEPARPAPPAPARASRAAAVAFAGIAELLGIALGVAGFFIASVPWNGSGIIAQALIPGPPLRIAFGIAAGAIAALLDGYLGWLVAHLLIELLRRATRAVRGGGADIILAVGGIGFGMGFMVGLDFGPLGGLAAAVEIELLAMLVSLVAWLARAPTASKPS